MSTEEFDSWYEDLTHKEQDKIDYLIELLEERGPGLRRPYADTVYDSRFSNMKELRTKTEISVLRAFFIFDPKQQAILLCGGDKQGENEKRFYKRMIDKADEIYEKHLNELNEQ